MKLKRLASLSAVSMMFPILVAAQSTVVYQDDAFTASARISACVSGCARQMAVDASYRFTFNGNYSALLDELEQLSLRTVAYDSSWQDVESGELVMKVSSTVHQRQRWRRSVLARRKVEDVASMAAAIYAVAVPGQQITLEFLQSPSPLSDMDFTINVRRYKGDSVVSSGSKAVVTPPIDDGDHTIPY